MSKRGPKPKAPAYVLPHMIDSTRREEFEFVAKAFQAYIVHLESGQPDGTFYFRSSEGHGIGPLALQRAITRYKSSLDIPSLEQALATRYKRWFDTGMALMEETKSSQLYLAFMRNLFKDQGWDPEASVLQKTFEPDVRKVLTAVGYEEEGVIDMAPVCTVKGDIK